MHTHYTKLKSKKIWRRLRLVFMIIFLLGASVLLAQRSKQDIPPVYAAINQIYPYNSSSGDINLYEESYSTCDGGQTACYDSPMRKTTNMFETEGDNVLTYKQSGAGWWGGRTPGSCCQADDWHKVRDSTRNHPSVQSKWASQTIKIPDNINKITQVKFYDGASGSLQLELINSARATLNQTTQSSGDFNNLNWPVTPNTTYKLKLTRLDNENLTLPVTSPCSGCTWYIQWGPNVETRIPDGQTPHSTTDAYTDGGAESESSYFSGISAGGTADIARMAVWGETVPIPVPVPVPVPVPSVPTGLTAACSSPGTTAALSWNPTSGATSYDLRVDNAPDSWNINSCATINSGDVCLNQTETSKSFTSVAGNTYKWWLHACNTSGCSAPVNGTSFTCTGPTAPRITGLQLTNFSPTQTSISGIYPVIGKQSGTQGGAGWLNPMKIALTVTAGDGINKKYYTAFYAEDQGVPNRTPSAFSVASTFLADVQGMLFDHPEAGWLLRYDDLTTPVYYVWDHSITSGGTDCTANGCFVDITTGFTLAGYNISNSQGLIYRVYPITGSPSWQVRVDARMGSKRMYTAGYAVSSAGSDLKVNMTPIQQ